jgi:molecular chaperone HtpG
MDVPNTKRILEVNLQHPLLRSLAELVKNAPESARVSSFIELVYDQALLAEGSPIDDPVKFAKQIAELVTHAAEREAASVAAAPAPSENPA